MVTKLPGETYRGVALHVPLSGDGQLPAYVWPLRSSGKDAAVQPSGLMSAMKKFCVSTVMTTGSLAKRR